MTDTRYQTVAQLFSDTGVLLPYGVDDIIITGVEYDSRQIEPGMIFFAIPGFKTDGADFVNHAIAGGASLVVAEHYVDCARPLIECAPIRRVLAEVSSAFYNHPSSEMTIIGVTGTNAKTTICSMVKSVMESAGHKTAQFGTVGNYIGESFEATLNTTPESKELQRLLRKSLEAGCRAAVFEVSSHALVLYRVHAIEFDLGIFTNLTGEHLDFHKDMDDYFNAKMKLFEYLRGAGKPAIINISDPFGQRIANYQGLDVMTYGDPKTAEVHIIDATFTPSGSLLEIHTPAGKLELRLGMPGRFNAENALAAIAAGLKCDISLNAIKDGLESFQPPAGRMQILDYGQPYQIIIDYAHTPDALTRLLASCKEFTSGKLITVFGCGGDRDKTKRAPMAQTVASFSDLAILTTDNPRTEDPEEILNQVQSGFPMGFEYLRESSREKAIRMALQIAKPGDTVVIAGKGHEKYQIFGTTRTYFSEEEVIKIFLESGR